MNIHSIFTSKRPYSMLEISSIKDLYLNAKNLSKVYIFHEKCNHRYRPRKSSAKELLSIMDMAVDTNCSVCFMQDHVPQPAVCADVENPKNIQQLLEFVLFYDWLYKHID